MRKAYTVFVQNYFLGNNSGKSEPIGTKFYRDTGSCGTPRANFCCPLPNRRDMAPQKRILRSFCQGNNALFHPLPGGRLSRNFNTKRESVLSWKLLEYNFNIFLKRVIFPKKTHFRGFGGTLAACTLQPWPLGLYDDSEHVPYSRRARDACSLSDFFVGLSFLPERDYVTFGSLLSQFRLSSVTLVHPTQEVEAFGKISSPLCTLAILWPPAKFYGDRPRGTPPSRALNARGVSKYSDFRPIEGYIS